MKDYALIVFAKNLIQGKVKTRIAQTTSEKKALEIYKELLIQTEKIISKLLYPAIYIYWDSYIPKEVFPFLDTKYNHRVQSGSDLGKKMENAFRELLGKYSTVCIIGTDCPTLTTEIIMKSFHAIDKGFDFSIGPALDGGYYLLAIQDTPEFWFSDIEWSTNTVYKTTIERANLKEYYGKALPRLSDIDTEEDYLKWKNSLT